MPAAAREEGQYGVKVSLVDVRKYTGPLIDQLRLPKANIRLDPFDRRPRRSYISYLLNKSIGIFSCGLVQLLERS